jgi:hypothetical protein
MTAMDVEDWEEDDTTPGGLPPGVDAAAYEAFKSRHSCIRVPFWRSQPVRRVWLETSGSCGIGVGWQAYCACGAEMNVSDYSCW